MTFVRVDIYLLMSVRLNIIPSNSAKLRSFVVQHWLLPMPPELEYRLQAPMPQLHPLLKTNAVEDAIASDNLYIIQPLSD